MAEIYAIFGTLLAFGIAFPGAVIAWWLLFPTRSDAAKQRIIDAPKRTAFIGTITLLITLVPIVILLSVPLPFAPILGIISAGLVLGYATIGATGLVSLMADRLQQRSHNLSNSAAFLRAVVALELAAIFPIVGWALVIPSCIVISLGAAVSSRRAQPQAPVRSADTAPVAIRFQETG